MLAQTPVMQCFDSTLTYRGLPRVALAGRPNTGKSTLFNRLARRRRAITDPTPGVTRDAVETTAFLAGKPVTLIDTGGFKLDRRSERDDRGGFENELDDLVLERTLETLRGADLIVLLFAAGEITPEDEEFIELVRPLREKTIACVNKTEGGRLQFESCNMYAYGFDELLFISAEHGDNILELEDAVAAKLDFSRVELDNAETRSIKIALIGKPNSGKSTLANRLTSSNNSLVSNIPGTTRDVVEGAFSHKGRAFVTLDTAGIRRKSKVDEAVEYYSVNRAIKSLDNADVVFHVIDAAEGLSEQDKKIAALSSERGRGVIFALNKWDAMPQIKNSFEAVRDRLRYFFPQMAFAPVLPVSALHGDGVARLLDTAVSMYAQLNRRTETAAFNRLLEQWQTECPPPSGPQTRFKIKYGLQTNANPVKFKLFVSRPQAWTESYAAYIRNKIRKDAGYAMIPIRLDCAPSREKRQK